MNEEISRILQMLESGKIKADAAERLIRAVNEKAAEQESNVFTCPNPFRDVQELMKLFARAMRQAGRRQRRWSTWRWYQFLRWQENERRERAKSQSVEERVRFILRERALVGDDEIQLSSSLQEDLSMGDLAREVLRIGLEYEFDIEISTEDAGKWAVQDVVSYVETRLKPAPEPAGESTPKPRTRKTASRKPATRRRGTASA